MGEVASPKNIDAAPAINGICQYSDNEELIYDCFINPKYKVYYLILFVEKSFLSVATFFAPGWDRVGL